MKKRGFFGRLFGKRQRAISRRSGLFEAATIDRLFADWLTSDYSINKELRESLSVIRARSRHFCTNSDHGKKFINLIKANVVGPEGIRLQAKAIDSIRPDGSEVLDNNANKWIEEAWKKWGRKKYCSVNGMYNLVDIQNVAATALARDGECLIRLVRDFDNDFRFSLQLLDADYLDEKKNDANLNIKMGIERDSWGRPLAYWLLNNHPGDFYDQTSVGQRHYRLPADQILHMFVVERPDQIRGVPWAHSALKRMKMASGYEEAELVASRVGAAKMGFFQDKEGTGYMGDDEDSEGRTITEVRPGGMERLPAGVEFKAFDADHPSTAFDAFMKAVLKGAAAGLNVQYSSLSADLREANYSSLRQGLLEERDHWMTIQSFVAEHLLSPIYETWLNWAMVSGQLRLPPRKADKFSRVMWQGRRWPWVDPQKDLNANKTAVELGIKSRTMIAAEQGRDIEDVFAEIQRETQLAEQYGITLNSGGNNNAESNTTGDPNQITDD